MSPMMSVDMLFHVFFQHPQGKFSFPKPLKWTKKVKLSKFLGRTAGMIELVTTPLLPKVF